MLYIWKRNTHTLVQTHSLAEWYGLSVGARLIHCCHGNPIKEGRWGDGEIGHILPFTHTHLSFIPAKSFLSVPFSPLASFSLAVTRSPSLSICSLSLSVVPSKSLTLCEYCLLSSTMSTAPIHLILSPHAFPSSSSSYSSSSCNLCSAQREYVPLPPTPHHISFCLWRELYLAHNRFLGLYPRSSQPLILSPCIRLSFSPSSCPRRSVHFCGQEHARALVFSPIKEESYKVMESQGRHTALIGVDRNGATGKACRMKKSKTHCIHCILKEYTTMHIYMIYIMYTDLQVCQIASKSARPVINELQTPTVYYKPSTAIWFIALLWNRGCFHTCRSVLTEPWCAK